MTDIVWFSDAHPDVAPDVALVGGKGHALAELRGLGFDVPEGFVVTTGVYRAAVADPLGARITALTDRLTGSGPGADDVLEAVSAQVRELVFTGTTAFPGADGVREAYAQLAERSGTTDPPVAVRSSSAAEDSSEQSFAGEHDSFLWVVGADAVLEAVRRCWASLFTARAISYRAHGDSPTGDSPAGDSPPGDDAMAVVVQRMVDARSAGVFMTLNPTNGDRSKVVIESVWGLGEPLVSGSVTPDRFTVDKITREILERVPADKPTRATRNPDTGTGVSEVAVQAADRERPSLSDEEILALVDVARSIETSRNRPQDGEFAVAGGRTYLVQARPETVWSSAPVARVSTGGADPLAHVLGALGAPTPAGGPPTEAR